MTKIRNYYTVGKRVVIQPDQDLSDLFDMVYVVEPGLGEQYRIRIQEQVLTITYDHIRGKQYAQDTLQGLVAEDALFYGLIEDGPRFVLRGIIEGFYGTPWSHEDRLDAISFLRRYRMNTYIYAPKDDPYHRDKWREPYPESELSNLMELIEFAATCNVDVMFTISPGKDFNYTLEEDFIALFDKIDAVISFGITDFALLLDDIDYQLKGDDLERFGTPGKAHAYISNRFDQHLANRLDSYHFVMCPTEYWQHTNSPYRTDLKEHLNESILVFWTGYNTIAEYIPNQDGELVKSYFGHDLILWDNYPVNDMTTDLMFTGPLINRGDQLDASHKGMVSNPMIEWSLSKIPLMTMSDYMWDPSTYDPEQSYVQAIHELVETGIQEQALLAVLENFRHSLIYYYTNPEQEEWIEQNDIAKLSAYYETMLRDITNVRTIHDTRFVAQLEPWLQRMEFDATIVFDLAKGNIESATKSLEKVAALTHTVNSNYAIKIAKKLGVYDGPIYRKNRPNYWR